MTVAKQTHTDDYSAYCGDCVEVLPTLPDQSIDLSIHSPPFAGLYQYSSSERDLSNCRTYDEFLRHYEFVVEQMARLTKPGRISAVHLMDVPKDGANVCGYTDFPGDVIRLHGRHGFEHLPRICIWKEPLGVRNRTMSKSLAHKQIVEDSTRTCVAAADYLIPFRRKGKNKVPVTHPVGLTSYAGERRVPEKLLRFRGWTGDQTKNRYSHWVWRQYASSVWMDIRIDRVLPYKPAREPDDERHCHPLQLDVIERACVLWSNPGETVLTPFAGVGSEVAGAVMNRRRGIGVELKQSYYNQMVKNLESVSKKLAAGEYECDQGDMFVGVKTEDDEEG
jgi:DNA modification methylase